MGAATGLGAAGWAAALAAGWLGYRLLRDRDRVRLRLDALERQAEQRPDLAPPGGTPRAALAIGSAAPDFAPADLTGQRHASAEWRGRAVTLIFVDPACEICRQMLPDLARVIAAVDSEATAPILLSSRDGEETRRLVRHYGLDCTALVQDDGEVAEDFRIPGTPAAYRLDESGRIASHLAVGAPEVLALVGRREAGDASPVAGARDGGRAANATAAADGRPLESGRVERATIRRRGPAGEPMGSLFVVSLPRSLSTLVYDAARAALGLRSPSWTVDGEILNVDRLAAYGGPRREEGAKFNTADGEPALFQKLTEFLDQVTVAQDFAYKDVVQPFVVAGWAGLRQYRVLRIKRDLTEVTDSMLARGWYYPRVAAPGAREGLPATPTPPGPGEPRITALIRSDARSLTSRHIRAVVQGLVLAERALDSIPAVTLNYDDLIWSEVALTAALQRLYPEHDVQPVSYITEQFCWQREVILQRRTSHHFQLLEPIVRRAIDALG